MGYNIDELLKNVYIKVHENQNILKMLYYPADNGDFDILAQSEVTGANKDDLVRKVSAEVELQELVDSEVKRGRIGIFLQSSTNTNNTYVPDRRVRIEIYMPIRNFEEYFYRIAFIVSELDNIFLQEEIDGGLGRLNIESSNQIGVKVDGYMTYYHDYSSGDLKGRGCV